MTTRSCENVTSDTIVNFLDSFLVLNMFRSPNNVIYRRYNIHTTTQQLTKPYLAVVLTSFQVNNLVILLSFYVTSLVRCFINSIIFKFTDQKET